MYKENGLNDFIYNVYFIKAYCITPGLCITINVQHNCYLKINEKDSVHTIIKASFDEH